MVLRIAAESCARRHRVQRTLYFPSAISVNNNVDYNVLVRQ